MDFKVATIKNDDGSTEIYFVGVEHWNDFDLLLGLLQQENECIILSNQVMVYKRKAFLTRNGIFFELRHDDMLGSFLYTTDIESIPMLENLASNIIRSIKDKLENRVQE